MLKQKPQPTQYSTSQHKDTNKYVIYLVEKKAYPSSCIVLPSPISVALFILFQK